MGHKRFPSGYKSRRKKGVPNRKQNPVTWPSRASRHPTPLHPLSNVSLTSFVKRRRRPLLRASQDSNLPPGFGAEALGQQPDSPPQGSGTWAGTKSPAWTKR